MTEMQLAFIIWIVVGLIFTIYGVIVMCSKKERPFGFWANSQAWYCPPRGMINFYLFKQA